MLIQKLKLFLFLIALGAAVSAHAQVSLWAPSKTACPGTAFNCPLLVQNMVGVDSFKMVLVFDANVIEYQSHFALHTALVGGTLNVSPVSGGLEIAWHRSTVASILNDTVIKVVFLSKQGQTPIAFQMQTSFFHSPTLGMIPVTATDGSISIFGRMDLLLTEEASTCPNHSDAIYKVVVDGGELPIKYLWNSKPGKYEIIPNESVSYGLPIGTSYLRVTDHHGCRVDTSFKIDGLPGADIDLIAQCKGMPVDVIYLQNPTLTFSYQEKGETHIIETPVWHMPNGVDVEGFTAEYTFDDAMLKLHDSISVSVYVKNGNQCDSTFTRQFPVRESALKIPNLIVKNSSITNNRFLILTDSLSSGTTTEDRMIKGQFKHIEVMVKDRWGRRVYKNDDYKNDWQAGDLPCGVYFYMIKAVGYYREDTYRGSISVYGD